MATSELLSTISRTRTDVGPVLKTIVDAAMKLCEADNAAFFSVVGDMLVLGAKAGPFMDELTTHIPLSKASLVATAIRERRSQHTMDALHDTRLDSEARGNDLATATRLAAPVLVDDNAVGVIRVARYAPGGFSQRQIELIETFADQAAIAIENVRLFNETKEALARPTAISEI